MSLSFVMSLLSSAAGRCRRFAGSAARAALPVVALLAAIAPLTLAQPAREGVGAGGGNPRPGGEANLILPDLSSVDFLGLDGHTLLLIGIAVCVLGLLFGLMIFVQLKNLPVHRSMREISELIYETCKTYLTTQGKFIMVLWLFIGAIVGIYFGFLAETYNEATRAIEHGFPAIKVFVILLFSLVGIAGSYGVA